VTGGAAGPAPPAGRTEQGAGTVLVVALAGALATSIVAVLLLGAAGLAKARAQAAADLAALAGAQALLDGLEASTACTEAGIVTRENGARLAQCSAVGDRCDIVATVEAAGPGGASWSATAWAKAAAGRPP
jgi:secretion/DNA translocation related TadE-like protein